MADPDKTRNGEGDGSKAASLFPIFLKLEGRPCLVVGAGSVGESKIRSLLEAGAEIHVVAPQASVTVAEWARTQKISWAAREFQPADLDGVFLVIAATSSSRLNGEIFAEAQQRKVLCNAVDDPANCDFYYPAVVRRGELQIAISTAGKSPALAQKLRQELEVRYGPEYAGFVNELGELRKQLFEREMDSEERRRRLHELAGREAAPAGKGETR